MSRVACGPTIHSPSGSEQNQEKTTKDQNTVPTSCTTFALVHEHLRSEYTNHWTYSTPFGHLSILWIVHQLLLRCRFGDVHLAGRLLQQAPPLLKVLAILTTTLDPTRSRVHPVLKTVRVCRRSTRLSPLPRTPHRPRTSILVPLITWKEGQEDDKVTNHLLPLGFRPLLPRLRKPHHHRRRARHLHKPRE